ncbi:18459_t:CDS:2 [Gigaspora margarita]|uniref:18459_t:CDS:1 n=1 Tax=Gigaspora margarita TaxID=4874 RepID=A0ABN7UU82_GIGMA|nr:18459_t:CDS:2 [Gigaspora margarita]
MTFILLAFTKLIKVKSGLIFDSCLSSSYLTNNPYNSLLNYNFDNDTIIKGDIVNVDLTKLCCNNSQCSQWPKTWYNCSQVNDSPITSNTTFYCNKFAQNDIFCFDINGLTCAGIVGDNKITRNITIGNCTGSEGFDGVANYLAAINIKDGNTRISCTNTRFCSDLTCWWDNEGWTCHNPDYSYQTFFAIGGYVLGVVGIISLSLAIIFYFWRKHSDELLNRFSS